MANDTKPPTGGEYEVGYGKPPKHSQWKPGQCGNSNGRPLKSKNKKSEYQVAMGRMHRVNIGGRMVRRTATEIMLEQAIVKAMKGDLKALGLLLKLGFDLGALKPLPTDETPHGGVIVIPTFMEARTAEDQLAMAYMYERQYQQGLREAEEKAAAEAKALPRKRSDDDIPRR